MEIIIGKNKKESIKKAVSIISKIVKKKPKSVLGLATGNTVIPLYKELVKKYKKNEINFSKVSTFNLDEYSGLSENDKKSFHYFMNKYFFNHVNISKKNIHFPNSNFKKYEKMIFASGGIDLQILGIGHNGHIGFNEPGSSFNSKVRKIKLSDDTRKFNYKFFRQSKSVPKHAFTMGIKTIMNSKKIILLAFGKEKAEAIAKTIHGKITTKVPASILRKHKNVIFIIDKKASGKLKQYHNKI